MSQAYDVKVPLASSLQQIVGALLFGADRPLTVEDIASCLKSVADADEADEASDVSIFSEASPNEIKEALGNIAKDLSRMEMGFELVEINGSFRFETQPCCGRWVRNLLKIDRPSRLSRPALETLAIVAYRQPIVKSEIESIRGVMVDHMLKALMELRLVRIIGRSELPGRPFLYGTTPAFLEHFGLKSLKDLDDIDPTLQRSKPSERKAMHKKKKARPDADAKPDVGTEVLFEQPDEPPSSADS